jgi:hypothetical protein
VRLIASYMALTGVLIMESTDKGKLVDGAKCDVVGGTHKGKSGVVRDIKTGKTGHISITVVHG